MPETIELELQQKLLRVILDGEFERLGSSQVRRNDVRVIAATNQNLESDVRDGEVVYSSGLKKNQLEYFRQRWNSRASGN